MSPPKSLREPETAPAPKRGRAASKKKAPETDDPLVALETEYDRADAAFLAASLAQEQAENELWRGQPHYVPTPAVVVGATHCMSEPPIREQCQPDNPNGPTEAERDAFLADFRRQQKAYHTARKKAGLGPG